VSAVFPLRSKRFAVSALEFLDAATLKAKRLECLLKEVAPTLSRPLRGLRQGVAHLPFVARSGLGRFAAFGPPTRIFIENAEKTSGRVQRGLSV